MKFTNAHIYRIFGGCTLPDLPAIEDSLTLNTFEPCTASQSESTGWTPPREEHGPLIESVGGQWIAKLMMESKSVPGSTLRRKLEERVKEIEKSTGRKPGKKEKKELKEDLLLEMLPMAFPKRVAIGVWIDPAKRTLVLDTASQSRADVVASAMVRAIEGLALSPANTVVAPSSAMAEWLSTQEAPLGFTIDRECELKATDESKSVVRYANHPLDIEEVQEHIRAGKRPTRLALTWEDRLSFILGDDGTLRGLTFLEGTVAGANETSVDEFDGNVAIVTGELSGLIASLNEALGGEAQSTIGGAL